MRFNLKKSITLMTSFCLALTFLCTSLYPSTVAQTPDTEGTFTEASEAEITGAEGAENETAPGIENFGVVNGFNTVDNPFKIDGASDGAGINTFVGINIFGTDGNDDEITVIVKPPRADGETEDIPDVGSEEIGESTERDGFKSFIEHKPGEKVILDVPYINQRVGYPNGCESVSAVMALNYLGYDITPEKFIEDYLDMGNPPYYKSGVRYGCDPVKQFPGDPRTDGGWGCYPEVIKNAIEKMDFSDFTVSSLKDASLSTLCHDYIDNGLPVVFWGTIDMNDPSTHITWEIEGTVETHTWISPFHCLLLVGYDNESYYFNDPWRKKAVAYGKKEVEISYNAIGRHALVVVPHSMF